MASDPHVRTVGTVEDMDGMPVAVGVNYDSVTVRAPAQALFNQGQVEEFARLLVAATWQAGQQAGYSRGRDDEAAGAEVPGG